MPGRKNADDRFYLWGDVIEEAVNEPTGVDELLRDVAPLGDFAAHRDLRAAGIEEDDR